MGLLTREGFWLGRMRRRDGKESNIRASAVKKPPAHLWCLCILACCHSGTLSAAEPLDQLESALPRRVDECDAQHVQQVVAAAQAVEAWAAARTWFPAQSPAHQVVGHIQQLIEAKARVDQCEQRILDLRTQFAPLEPAPRGANGSAHTCPSLHT